MARLFGIGDSYEDIIGDFDTSGGGADFSGMSDALDDSSDSSSDVADNLGSASESAKEIKKQLMGIDEINNMTLPDTDSSSSSGSGSSGGSGITNGLEWDLPTTPDPDPMMDELTEKIEKKLQHIFKPIQDSYNYYMPQIWEHLTAGFENVGYIASSVFATIESNWGNWAGSASDLFFSISNTVATAFEGVTIILRSVWDNGGQYLFEQLGNLIASIMRFATTINDYIVQPFLEAFNQNIAPVVGEFIGGALKDLGDKIGELSDWFDEFSEDIKTAFGDGKTSVEEFNGAMERIKEKATWLIGIGGAILVAFNFSHIISAVSGLGTIISGLSTGFTSLVGIVTSIMTFPSAISNLVTSMGGFSGILNTITQKIPFLSTGIAEAGTASSTSSGLLSGLGSSLSGLLNPFTLVSAAVVGLVAGFVYCYTTSEEFRDKMNEIFSDIKDQVSEAIDGIIEIFTTLYEDGIKPIVDRISEAFDNLWNGGLKDLVENVSMFVGTLVETLLSFWNNVLQPIINLLASILMPIISTIVDLVMSVVEPAIVAIMEHLNFILPIITELINFIGESVFPVVNTVISTITSIVQAFFDFFQPIIDIIMSILSEVVYFLVGSVVNSFQNVYIVISSAIETLCSIIEGIFTVASNVWDMIVGVLNTVGSWIYDNIIQPVFDFFDGLFEDIGNFASDAWQGIQDTFNGVGTWFYEKVIQPVKDFFSELWDKIKSLASDAWNGIKQPFTDAKNWFKDKVLTPIKNVFSDVWNGIKDTVSNIWDKILNLFSSGGKIFSGVVDGVANVFKTIVNSLIKGINKVIAVPFNTINGLLNTIRSISILGVSPFKGLWSKNPLPVPQIPQLASGGIAYGDTLIEVGEYVNTKNNPEVIAPLNDLNGIMANSIKQILQEEQQKQNDNTNSNLNQEDRYVNANIYLNGKLFYKEMVKEDRKEKRNSGRSPLGSGV